MVPPAGEAESNRATLRIDSDRPVPAPPLSAEDANAHRQGTAERELDRLNQAATVEQLALGQHVNWLIASQAIFIHAFLMLFIVSGMGVVSLRENVPLVTERPLLAVASHTHFDHVGHHHEFPCRLCHAAEAHLLRAPTRENTYADKYVTDDIFTALPPEPYRSETYTVEAAPVQRILWDGDLVDLGDRQFQDVLGSVLLQLRD